MGREGGAVPHTGCLLRGWVRPRQHNRRSRNLANAMSTRVRRPRASLLRSHRLRFPRGTLRRPLRPPARARRRSGRRPPRHFDDDGSAALAAEPAVCERATAAAGDTADLGPPDAPARRPRSPSIPALSSAAPPWRCRRAVPCSSARRFAAAREGRVSFAVLGPGGRITGPGTDTTYESASLVKAMILVAYLRMLAAEEREPTELELAAHGRHDPGVATTSRPATLYEDAWAPRPSRSSPPRPECGTFATSIHSGATASFRPPDQVRFFLSLDRLLPAAHRDFARDLLENVASFRRLGVPPGRAARLARLLQGRLAAG